MPKMDEPILDTANWDSICIYLTVWFIVEGYVWPTVGQHLFALGFTFVCLVPRKLLTCLQKVSK